MQRRKEKEVTIDNWISTKDRLPDKGDIKDYLVTDGKRCFVAHYRHDAQAWDNYVTGWLMKVEGGEWVDVCVTHWQPLPELPNKSKKKW